MLKLPIDLLQPGMVLAKPVMNSRGSILLRQGVTLSDEYILNLQRRGFPSAYISDGDTDDVIVEDLLSNEVRRHTQATLSRIFDFVKHLSADFANMHVDTIVAGIRDTGVVNALRSYNGFNQLDEIVSSIIDDLAPGGIITNPTSIRSHADTILSHSIDMTTVALFFGKNMRMKFRDLKRLGVGCLLHDIGKIFINPAVFKNGPTHLSPTIQLRIKEHPRLGYELLRARSPNAVISNHIALEHHERQDGRGYPRRMYGTNTIDRPRFDRQNILLLAEIAAIADIYDLLSAEKPAQQALSPRKIINTLRHLSGTFLNKELVDIFLDMIPVLPTGTNIIAKTGRFGGYRGVVVRGNKKYPDRPLVRLLYNEHTDRIIPIEIDLAHDKTTTVEAILHQ